MAAKTLYRGTFIRGIYIMVMNFVDKIGQLSYFEDMRD